LTIKKIVLSASLLVAGNAVAQDKTYTVKDGDTLSEIASKFGVKTHAVLAANNLTSADKLKLGQKLRIPVAAAAKKSTVSDRSANHHVYTVQDGDNDIKIAKHLGVSAKAVRLANPGIKWTTIKPGQTLNIPGAHNGWFASVAHGTSKAPAAKLVAAHKGAAPAKATKKPTVVARTYKVQEGDNDWIIAKKVGTKPSVLRNLNPDVKWGALQIGHTVRIPGSTTVAKNEPSVKRIRTRYAVITGDAVTLRRGPGTDHEAVTQVDGGTRVLVLDRQGSWYKARFPRGTEAWVRGDFLKSASAPVEVASNERRHKKKHETVVASREPLRSSSRSSRSRHENASHTKVARSGHHSSNGGGSVREIDADGNPVISRAKSMMGVRYRYGAMSRGATDCSGLTGQCYRAAGVSLPRTAIEQSRVGKAVSKDQLKPGDLVFFKTNRGIRVNHTGIYIGGGKFIHASSGRGQVMTSSLNEGYYQRRYAGGRHVANFGSSKKHKETKHVAKAEDKAAEPTVTPVDPPASDGGN